MEPPRVKPTGLADYLDALSKPVFQAGISWKVVDTKWPSIREAFHHFDPEWVAGLSPRDVDRLAADPRVIRNRTVGEDVPPYDDWAASRGLMPEEKA